MTTKNENSTVAYICPVCGETVVSGVDVLRLTGDLLKLKCRCGMSELIIMKSDGKLKITVPCLLCGTDHTYAFSGSICAERELFSGSCPYSGIDIFFFGKKSRVLSAAKKASDIIAKSVSEEDLSTLANRIKRPEKDIQTRDMLMLVFSEMMIDGKIFCGCTEAGEEGDYTMRETDEAVLLECHKCGRMRAAYCDSSIATQDILESTSITLH